MHCWNWSFFFVLDDKWIGHPLAQQFPELYSFAINNNVSLANVLDTQNLAYVFHRPLSNQTFLQFKELEQRGWAKLIQIHLLTYDLEG